MGFWKFSQEGRGEGWGFKVHRNPGRSRGGREGLEPKKGLFGDPEHLTLEFSLNLKKML